jgi:hypothetical protein
MLLNARLMSIVDGSQHESALCTNEVLFEDPVAGFAFFARFSNGSSAISACEPPKHHFLDTESNLSRAVENTNTLLSGAEEYGIIIHSELAIDSHDFVLPAA